MRMQRTTPNDLWNDYRSLDPIWSDHTPLDPEPWTPEDACIQGRRTTMQESTVNRYGRGQIASKRSLWSSTERNLRKDDPT